MLSNTLRTRGLHAAVRFAPAATLDKQHKQQFQVKCGEGFDWRREEYNENLWVVQSPQTQGDPRSQLKLSLQRDLLTFEDHFPTGSLDLFNDNLQMVLNGFAAVFNPRLIVGSGAVIRMTVEAPGGDARVFLGNRTLQMGDKLSPIGRPIHAVGLRLLLPPLTGENQPNWQAEVKIESLVEDYRQIFIEVDARWGTSMVWNPEDVLGHLRTAHEFASSRVVPFLEQFEDRSPPANG